MPTRTATQTSPEPKAQEPRGYVLTDEPTAAALTADALAEAQAFATGYGKLKEHASKVAQMLFSLRQCFTKDGEPDWYGGSAAYKAHVSQQVYVPAFGEQPKDDAERAAWRSSSGYGSFKATLSRAMDAIIAEAQANGTMPERATRTNAGGSRKTAYGVLRDNVASIARDNTASGDVPTTDLLGTASGALSIIVDAIEQRKGAGTFKATAPAKVAKLIAQVRSDLDRIEQAFAEAQSNRNGRTGSKAA